MLIQKFSGDFSDHPRVSYFVDSEYFWVGHPHPLTISLPNFSIWLTMLETC